MSFGYSVGDVIGGANLAYQLLRIMSDIKGASQEYQDAMAELGAMQQAFIQVSQMKSHAMLPQSTINAASHIVMSSMEIIEKFLQRTKQYQRQLSNPSGLQSSWYKVGWTLYKAQELRTLRDSLHSRLTSVNMLLAAASHCHPLPAAIARYRVVEINSNATTDLPPREYEDKESKQDTTTPAPSKPEDGVPDKPGNSLRTPREPTKSSYISTSLSHESVGRVAELLQKPRQTEGTQLPQPTVPPQAQDSQLEEIRDLITSLGAKLIPESGAEKSSIKFTDAVGRKFVFPWAVCKTWQGMEDLIKQAFLQVDVLGPHVQEGHYDLIGPNGEIILPSIWEKSVEPDWVIKMTMWPMDKAPPLREHRPPGLPSVPKLLRPNASPGNYEERSHRPRTWGSFFASPPRSRDKVSGSTSHITTADRRSRSQPYHALQHNPRSIIQDQGSDLVDVEGTMKEGKLKEKTKEGRGYQEEKSAEKNNTVLEEVIRRMQLKGKTTKLKAAMTLRELGNEGVIDRYLINGPQKTKKN